MSEKRKYSDRREYLIAAVTKKRRKLKLWVIEYKGGRCILCGYNRFQGALDLHHVYGKKEYGMGDKGYSQSKDNLQKELDKCVLLCANCHREVEGGVLSVADARKQRKFLCDELK